MQRTFPVLLSLLLSYTMYGQVASDLGLWLDHLPYGVGVDIIENDHIVYCATEQGLFFYDNNEKTIERLSKTNGLSDVGLTSIGWSDKHQLLLVGYENGNLDIVQNERVTNVPDIKQSGNYSGLKRINHIETIEDVAYICTDFGILTYDLLRDVVIDNFIIGDAGITLGVNDLAFSDDSIFAATDEGLYAASLSEPLIFFENWRRDNSIGKPISNVTYFGGRLMVSKYIAQSGDSVFYKQNGQWRFADEIVFMNNVRDMHEDKGMLVIADAFSSQVYDPSLKMVFNLQAAATDNPSMAPAAAAMGTDPNVFWVMDSRKGLYKRFRYQGNAYVDHILPNAPFSKNVINLYHDDEQLYVAPGGIIDVWAPAFNNDGFYRLKDYSWSNYSNHQFEEYKDIVAFISDPEDPERFYASSYGNGILEFRKNEGEIEFVGIINSASTGGSMQPISQEGNHRVGGFSADPDGNIWFSNSLTDQPLGKISPDGTVVTFSLGSSANSSTAVKDVLYTTNDQIWLQTRTRGVVVAYFVNGQLTSKLLTAAEGRGNLPTDNVLCFAEDQDGEIWIGTNEGLAVLYSPQNVSEPNRNYDAQIIVIENSEGSGDRVLGSQVINDIEVDGSNKKWFATANSGVFYTSENGKQQLQHFNRENSPLPSNNVLDIEIDQVTGMVYFATDQGIVSYQGNATEGATSHTDVFAYPNPVEPGYEGPILIRGLVTNAQVKITDIEGNIVYETVAEGGQAVWSGRSHSGERAKSGVYLAYITNDIGSATAVTKILIVN